MKNISIFFAALVAVLFSVAETSAQITPPYYNPANVRITGGTINGTVIGGTTAAASTFTTATFNSSAGTVGNRSFLDSPSGDGRFGISRDSINYSYFDSSGSNHGIGTAYAGNFYLRYNNVDTAAVTSTGLAVTGTLSATGSVRSTGANTAVAASQTVVDNSGSVARFIGFGPDAGTNATVRISSVRSDGTNEVQYDFSGTGLAVTGGISATGDVAFGKTITTPGTTGAVTINKTTGRVNFAAAATSLVVTNSLATANSICHVTKATNDATMRLGACVAAAGSITIYADVAPAAETAVNFTVTN